MLEEYIKKLETLITPKYYNKSNFKEKIKAEFEDPADVEEKKKRLSMNTELFNKIQGEEDKKLMEAYIQKMGSKELLLDQDNKITDENKMRIYQKILDNEANLENEIKTFSSIEYRSHNLDVQSVTSKGNKTYSLSPSRRRFSENMDEMSYKEKIHLLNIKNMNYRYELESAKSKIAELNKNIDNQQIEISKLEKQRESSNKYLLKLEGLLSQQSNPIEHRSSVSFSTSPERRISSTGTVGKNLKIQTKSTGNTLNTINNSKSDNFISDFNRSNNNLTLEKNHSPLITNDRGDMRDYINSLLAENQKLKAFQSQVFELSKNYDNINEGMLDSMKQIQNIANQVGENNLRKFDENQMQQLTAHFDKLVETMEKSMEIKQTEYNFLLDAKDQEIKFLQEEILKLNEKIEIVKRDRMRDQKILSDYESEINFLSSRVSELNDKSTENRNVEVVNNNTINLEKKIQPARKSVQKIVKKFERTFDLQDKNNVKMLSNINKSLK